MPIYRLLQNSSEDVTHLVAAYEETLRALGLVDRTDPVTELVARKVIEIGQTGIREAREISRLAVEALTTWLGAAPKGPLLYERKEAQSQ